MQELSTQRYIISADIGGSHITTAVIDQMNQYIVSGTRRRHAVNPHESAENIMTTWVNSINEVKMAFPEAIHRLSLAMPGPFDYRNGVSLITGLYKYESLFGVNVKDFLSLKLGFRPEDINFRNDAEAFLHGEVVAGAGKGYGKVIGLTLGTGMGSAISSDGITTDANWGSEPFGQSIADDHFSTRWFLKAYALLSPTSCANVRELAELAAIDDIAASVFVSFAKSLSRFLSEKVLYHKPDLLVIGGNISKAHLWYLPELRLQLSPYLDPDRIVTEALGEDAALIGAAFTFLPVPQKSTQNL